MPGNAWFVSLYTPKNDGYIDVNSCSLMGSTRNISVNGTDKPPQTELETIFSDIANKLGIGDLAIRDGKGLNLCMGQHFGRYRQAYSDWTELLQTPNKEHLPFQEYTRQHGCKGHNVSTGRF